MTTNGRSTGRRAAIAAGPAWLLALGAACAPTQVQEAGRYRGPPLPPPQRIFVADLGVMPGDVKLDDGVRARLVRELSNEPASDARVDAGRQAAGAVTEEVASRLRGYGLPAERAAAAPPRLPGPSVVVEGHVVSVDEGNRTRRTIVGFGAGQSSVAVEVQVYYRQGAAPPLLLDQFELRAASPRAPGAIGTVGAGAVAGRVAEAAAATGILHGVSETRSADPGSEGRRIGDALALRLGRLFADLGWVSAAAVR
jgi:hypothetical protein